jgi:signal transduction histidine kinase
MAMRPFGGETRHRLDTPAAAGTSLAGPARSGAPAVPWPATWLLAATAAVVGTGELAHAWGWTDAAGVALLAAAQAAVGIVWLAVTRARLADVDDDGDAQVRAEVDLALRASRREERERLHELRSTVAGLVNGSALLDNPGLGDDARRHLRESVHLELQRMQRLLSGEDQTTTEVDVQQALQSVLDLQRLKGRRVELHTDGGTVRARQDALAEAVNILMDNAATHGGCDTSRVDVVCRGGEVDITVSDEGRGIPEDKREHIFDWGERGADSPGEGIGLHVARRLMAEEGGSLRLAESRGAGSSFVISLPAVRRSPEDDTSHEDSHVAWRLSS